MMKTASAIDVGSIPRIVSIQKSQHAIFWVFPGVLFAITILILRTVPISALTVVVYLAILSWVFVGTRWYRVGIAANAERMAVIGYLFYRVFSMSEVRRVSFGRTSADVTIEMLDGSSYYRQYGMRFVLGGRHQSLQFDYARRLRRAAGFDTHPRAPKDAGFEVRVERETIGGQLRPMGTVTTRRTFLLGFSRREVLVLCGSAALLAVIMFA